MRRYYQKKNFPELKSSSHPPFTSPFAPSDDKTRSNQPAYKNGGYVYAKKKSCFSFKVAKKIRKMPLPFADLVFLFDMTRSHAPRYNKVRRVVSRVIFWFFFFGAINEKTFFPFTYLSELLFCSFCFAVFLCEGWGQFTHAHFNSIRLWAMWHTPFCFIVHFLFSR